MHHSKYQSVKALVEAGHPVRLQGSAGTGKTTIAMQIAEELGLSFESLSMTKQTTVAHIVGFMSISGTYIPTRFRKAYEEGGLFLLDEIDAADPNTLLCLNSLENGYMSFPDGIVYAHKDFRLIATSNPDDEHSIYTGRSKLDFSTKDRFWDVMIPRDHNLEATLTSEETIKEVELARKTLQDNNSTQQITMRDAMRYHKSKNLDLDLDILSILIKDPILLDAHKQNLTKIEEIQQVASKDLNDITDFNELFDTIVTQSKSLDPSS